MRKAKVVAIACGVAAACLFGGFAVVDAATVTLDESSTVGIVETAPETTAATTVTSIETTTTATSTIASTEATTETTEATTEAEEEEITEEIVTEAPEEETEAAAVTEAAPMTEAPTEAPEETETANKTEEVTYTEAVVSASEETDVDAEAVTEAPAPTEPEKAPAASAASVSNSDYILLCNAVAHEAGGNSISVADKALVVEVIMNRVKSPKFPNTVYGVLTQPAQFSGAYSYVNLGTYSSKVTEQVKQSVDLYFSDPSAFNHGYTGFTGDGTRNYFT